MAGGANLANRGNKYVNFWDGDAITADGGSGKKNNPGYRGIVVEIYVPTGGRSGTSPTLDLKLQGYNKGADDYIDITGAAFAQITGASTLPYKENLTIYPGIAAASNDTVSAVLPESFRLYADVGGTNPSWTLYAYGALLA